IGGAVGLAVLIAIANSAGGGGTKDTGQLMDGVTTATWAIAVGIALTFLVVLNFKKPAADDGTDAVGTGPAEGTAEPVEVTTRTTGAPLRPGRRRYPVHCRGGSRASPSPFNGRTPQGSRPPT